MRLIARSLVKANLALHLAEEDIGIISPYHAQCSKLRASLKASDRLKIGSVEEFQGQVR